MANFWLTFETVAPIFAIILVGIFLKKTKIVDLEFDLRANQIIFNVALPAIVFLSIASSDLKSIFSWKLFALVQFSVVLTVVLSFIFFHLTNFKRPNAGVFIQSTYRSNYAIVGFATLQNMYGDTALIKGSVILLFIMPTFNLFSIWLLSFYGNEQRLTFRLFLKTILLNPLIISLILALPFALMNLGLPVVARKTLHYLGQIALPLALLTMGASLDVSKVRKEIALSSIAVFLKLLFFPALFTLLAILLDYRDLELASLCLLYATPTAMASYTLVRKFGGNETLAAAIIIMSTVLSVITIPLFLAILKALNYI